MPPSKPRLRKGRVLMPQQLVQRKGARFQELPRILAWVPLMVAVLCMPVWALAGCLSVPLGVVCFIFCVIGLILSLVVSMALLFYKERRVEALLLILSTIVLFPLYLMVVLTLVFG
ncbi:MAG: hypothetical protein IKJ58_07665 [Akkermansia sp.]|nr:hypothetical protein [Akkermansia sp.]